MRSRELLLQRFVHREKPELRTGRVLVGTAVKWDLSQHAKEYIAGQINTELQLNKETMEVVDQEQLIEAMDDGKFVLVLGDKNLLLGCAQVSEDQKHFNRIVIGTWLSIPNERYERGAGSLAIRHAAELALTRYGFYGAEKVVAKVRHDNTKPQEILTEYLGAEFLEQEISDRTGNLVNVYDLTKIGLQGVHE